MNTVAQVLLECEINDKLEDGLGNFWTVISRYEEDNKNGNSVDIIVIAKPDSNNDKDFELWSIGLEQHVLMEGLKKI